jgi:hypothetical protein
LCFLAGAHVPFLRCGIVHRSCSLCARPIGQFLSMSTIHDIVSVVNPT